MSVSTATSQRGTILMADPYRAVELRDFWIVMIGRKYMRPGKIAGNPLPACTGNVDNAKKYASLQHASKVVRDLILARERVLAIRGGGSLKKRARDPVVLLRFVVTIEPVPIRRPCGPSALKPSIKKRMSP